MKKISKLWNLQLIVMLIIMVIAQSCQEEATAFDGPELTTTEVSIVTNNTAESGGVITDKGGSNVVSRGVCWSKETEPTIADSKTIDGSGTGSFTSEISEFEASTTYYVRAYATNETDTGYGNQVTFNTTSADNNSLSAIIDEQAYIPTSVSTSVMSEKIVISGINGSKNLLIWLPVTLTTGIHSLGLTGDYVAQYHPGISNIFTSESGRIEILEHNDVSGKIRGTFSFVGTNSTSTVDVTNGSFEVIYK